MKILPFLALAGCACGIFYAGVQFGQRKSHKYGRRIVPATASVVNVQFAIDMAKPGDTVILPDMTEIWTKSWNVVTYSNTLTDTGVIDKLSGLSGVGVAE